MQYFDLLDVEPVGQLRRVENQVATLGRADRSAGTQRHERIFQESVERGRRELTEACTWSSTDRFDLPTHVVIDAFQPAENRFWFACRTGCEVDRARRIRIARHARTLAAVILG